MPLDAKFVMLLEQMKRMPSAPMHTLTPDEARENVANAFSMMKLPDVPVASVTDIAIQTANRRTPIRVYRPSGVGPFPVIVLFHGGGFVLGTLIQYDDVCRRLTNTAEAVVFSVDYGLAPEYKFPNPVIEAYSVTQYVAEQAAEYDGDASRLAVAGDSAGGTLATAVTLLARDRGGPNIAYQMLWYPSVDMAGDTESRRTNGSGFFLEQEDMVWFGQQYLNGPEDVINPLASPLRAESFADLPAAFIATAEFDPLRDEGQDYAHRLATAGVPVTQKLYDGMIHGFMNFTWLVPQAQQLIDDSAAAFRTAMDKIQESD